MEKYDQQTELGQICVPLTVTNWIWQKIMQKWSELLKQAKMLNKLKT